MLEIRLDLGGHFFRRQNKVRQARGNGAAGHAVEFGGFFILNHDHAAVFLDGPDAPHAVAAGTGQDDANSPGALVLGQGAQEDVDGQVEALGQFLVFEQEFAVKNGEIFFGRDQVYGFRHHGHAVFGPEYRHFRFFGQQFHHQAFVIR